MMFKVSESKLEIIYSILLYTDHNHNKTLINQTINPLKKKDYMYDGSSKLHKWINSIE